MIVGLCGQAGSGKDAVADFMVRNHGFVKVAFADPLKRICQDVFGFTDEQLWGPSEKRNAPDERYLRRQHTNEFGDHLSDEYLTPRFALQQLGTEWGRNCYPDIWVEYALRVSRRLNEGGHVYNARRGLSSCSFVGEDAAGAHDRLKRHVVVSDVRFANEVRLLRAAGAKVVRIVRKSGMKLLEGAAGQHVSETEQQGLSDDLFDHHLINGGNGLELLEAAVAGLVETIRPA